MKLVGDFLSRFKNITPPDGALKRVVSDAVRTVTGVSVRVEGVSIARGVVFLKVSSVQKNVIRMGRRGVLDEIYRVLPKARESVRDIR